MPKLKTHKGTAKRFKVTGNGKVMRMHGGKSHLRTAKSKRVKRMYDEKEPLHKADLTRIKRLIPYA